MNNPLLFTCELSGATISGTSVYQIKIVNKEGNYVRNMIVDRAIVKEDVSVLEKEKLEVGSYLDQYFR